MHCPNCGNKELSDTQKFCVECGKENHNYREIPPEKLNTQTISNESKVKSNPSLGIVRYIIGILFSFLALLFITSGDVLSGFLILLAVSLILPVSSNFIKSYLNIKLPKVLKTIIIIILICISFGLTDTSTTTPATTTTEPSVNTNESNKTPPVVKDNPRTLKAKKLITSSRESLQKGNIEVALEKCNEVIKDYSDTAILAEAIELQSEIESHIIPVTASQLSKEYADNEVKADNTYKNKLISVTGVIDSIGKDILDETYVKLSDGKAYSISGPQCYFKDSSEINKVAELVKGQKVTIIGTCDGVSITTPMLKNCKVK